MCVRIQTREKARKVIAAGYKIASGGFCASFLLMFWKEEWVEPGFQILTCALSGLALIRTFELGLEKLPLADPGIKPHPLPPSQPPPPPPAPVPAPLIPNCPLAGTARKALPLPRKRHHLISQSGTQSRLLFPDSRRKSPLKLSHPVASQSGRSSGGSRIQ